MTFQIIFVISGLALAALIVAKVWEGRSRKKSMLLRLISLGDARARFFSHEFAHRYFDWKEEADFFVNKELPLKTRNFVQKTNTAIKDKAMGYIGDIRGSKFLKQSDGLSEFFKSLSEKENGRIDEPLDDRDSKNEESEVK